MGYDAASDWHHPNRRTLVFLGDLVDRGDAPLEVVELVARLVAERRAVCLMGNHEYNLVAHFLRVPGYEEPKHSNAATISQWNQVPDRRDRALAFLAALPLAIDLPDLRIVHACWEGNVIQQLGRLLAPQSGSTNKDTVSYIESGVVLRSPFANGRLVHGLPGDTADLEAEIPHEVLIKGPELPAPAFADADGKLRHRQRALWWQDARVQVPRDKPIVFGHYWHVPPVTGLFVPPHASGTKDLRDWAIGIAPDVPPTGRVAMSGNVVCVDFNGVLLAGGRPVLGALRWPEREVVWAAG